MRRFTIGDVHGCAKALRSLIEAINPLPDDELVFLGDYVDRGPNSRDVVTQILELRQRCRVVALRGNHEIMLLGVALGGLDPDIWLENGGVATVTSYGGSLAKIPAAHLDFFQALKPYYETEDCIFVHACYNHLLEMHQQDANTIYWQHLGPLLPLPHQSGKRVFVGHTPQANGCVLHGGHVVCIDTYCFGGGFLTAFETDTNQVIQADRHGHLRRDPIQRLAGHAQRTIRLVSQLYQKTPMARRGKRSVMSTEMTDATINPALPDPALTDPALPDPALPDPALPDPVLTDPATPADDPGANNNGSDGEPSAST